MARACARAVTEKAAREAATCVKSGDSVGIGLSVTSQAQHYGRAIATYWWAMCSCGALKRVAQGTKEWHQPELRVMRGAQKQRRSQGEETGTRVIATRNLCRGWTKRPIADLLFRRKTSTDRFGATYAVTRKPLMARSTTPSPAASSWRAPCWPRGKGCVGECSCTGSRIGAAVLRARSTPLIERDRGAAVAAEPYSIEGRRALWSRAGLAVCGSTSSASTPTTVRGGAA